MRARDFYALALCPTDFSSTSSTLLQANITLITSSLATGITGNQPTLRQLHHRWLLESREIIIVGMHPMAGLFDSRHKKIVGTRNHAQQATVKELWERWSVGITQNDKVEMDMLFYRARRSQIQYKCSNFLVLMSNKTCLLYGVAPFRLSALERFLWSFLTILGGRK